MEKEDLIRAWRTEGKFRNCIVENKAQDRNSFFKGEDNVSKKLENRSRPGCGDTAGMHGWPQRCCETFGHNCSVTAYDHADCIRHGSAPWC
jgi:hypothetical protein